MMIVLCSLSACATEAGPVNKVVQLLSALELKIKVERREF